MSLNIFIISRIANVIKTKDNLKKIVIMKGGKEAKSMYAVLLPYRLDIEIFKALYPNVLTDDPEFRAIVIT